MKGSGEILFRPYFVQRGRGPHLAECVYASDVQWDTFHSNIKLTNDGIKISAAEGQRFAIHVRWNVEGYGYLFQAADNGGDGYEPGFRELNLNYELAKSRIEGNRRRFQALRQESWQPSRASLSCMELSMNYLDDARKTQANPELCAGYAQQALAHGLLASELIELERARSAVQKNRRDFLFGCDARAFFQMPTDLFCDRFSQLFNYATITHYLIGDVINFEPQEGQKNFTERAALCDLLRQRNITVEGRPLFWAHAWVTPDWLRRKDYDALKLYLEKHIREVISFYGDRMHVWEVVNELHDWANELELSPDQCVDLTKFACDIARDVNPQVRLLINNCCPFAEYVQLGKWHEKPARHPQRTPLQFIRQLIEADVDFDIVGAQVYFVKRPIADVIAMIERYESLGKRVHLSEVGAPSRGITQEFHETERDFSVEPYEWRRHWDEELQADWLEQIFTYAYSRPLIEAANWYDFLDPHSFLQSGGLLRKDTFAPKAAVDRLLKCQAEWNCR
ncbi:endo-1,4-beta-xylanase [candidate division KSB1 bacterium]|nr:endo-1,4-beta-xylanase [candidate division KSB1 bacterium]